MNVYVCTFVNGSLIVSLCVCLSYCKCKCHCIYVCAPVFLLFFVLSLENVSVSVLVICVGFCS